MICYINTALCLGGEDELNCPYNPVGSSRKRIGRQNDQHELPNVGDGGEGGSSSSSSSSNDSHEERISQTLPTTEAPILSATATVVQSTESTTPVRNPHSDIPFIEPIPEEPKTNVDPTTQTPAVVITSPEPVLPSELDPNNDPDNAGPNKDTDHRDNLLTTTSSSASISTSTSTTTTTSTHSSTSSSTTPSPITSTTTITSTSTSSSPSTSTSTTTTPSTTTSTTFTTITTTPSKGLVVHEATTFECRE